MAKIVFNLYIFWDPGFNFPLDSGESKVAASFEVGRQSYLMNTTFPQKCIYLTNLSNISVSFVDADLHFPTGQWKIQDSWPSCPRKYCSWYSCSSFVKMWHLGVILCTLWGPWFYFPSASILSEFFVHLIGQGGSIFEELMTHYWWDAVL